MTEVTRTFQFDEPNDDDKPNRPVIEINGEKFPCAELTGFELLRWIGQTGQLGPNSTLAIARFFERIIGDDDWERWFKLGEKLKIKPKQYADVASQVLDAYAAFPTTPASGSSSGGTSTGSTSGSDSDSPATSQG